MRRLRVIGLFIAVTFCLPTWAQQVLFSDNFESYSLGELNKNDSASPNAAPNGSGNPWWGPGAGTTVQPAGSIASQLVSAGNQSGVAQPAAATSTEMLVVGAQNGVTPHSGTKMITGSPGSNNYSELWNNIAYRYNGGKAISGNLIYTFWFYDPNGTTNGAAYKDNSDVAFYSDNSSTADYPSSGTLNNSLTIERLQLGAASYQVNTSGYPQTYNSSEYQARVVNTQIGYDTQGWINLPITRSVGWHEGEEIIGPADSDGRNTVSFYIDNLTTPLLTTTTEIDQGYTDVEFNAGGTTNDLGYFDDATLTLTPEPLSLAASPLLGLLLMRRRRR
jgi:hypothetical protein